jgi:hypothetical protein
MPQYLEWDYDNPKHPRRRQPSTPVLEGEGLPQQDEQPRVRVEVIHHHRHHGPTPQRIVIIAAFVILALILFRSPGALILLAALIPGHFWIACGVIVATLAIIAINERLRGRPF